MNQSLTKTKAANRPSFESAIVPQELLNLIPSVIVILSADGTIVEANSHAVQLLSVEGQSIVDSSMYAFCPVEEGKRLRSHVDRCVGECRTVSLVTKLQRGDSDPVDVEVSLSCYPSNRKFRLRYCVLVGRDISEEKKKELDLLRFSNIAHYTVNPLEITDAQGQIIYVNPAFEKTSGYSKEELIGRNPNIFGSGKHPKAFWKKMWETITAGKTWVGEVENKRRNGEPFFTQLLISPIIDANAKVVGYFGVHRDISEQKQLEQQLVHAQKMESIGMLAAGLAHEVGNPLTSISSLVQVIQRESNDEFIDEKLGLIKSQVVRISRIIRDLVDFSRRSSYEVQLTSINKSLHAAVEIVRVGKKAKEISFVVDVDEAIPSLPLVPDQIEQVFINILINAVDAIHENSKSLSRKKGTIQIGSSMAGEQIRVTIRDNGKGITEEMLPKIFEPFFTTKKVGEGTGLGLWVSYGIIKSFQGNIEVESITGEGTTFTISLPLHS